MYLVFCNENKTNILHTRIHYLCKFQACVIFYQTFLLGAGYIFPKQKGVIRCCETMCTKNSTHMYVLWTSNIRARRAYDLYSCLLLQCETLHICCSNLLIAKKTSFQHQLCLMCKIPSFWPIVHITVIIWKVLISVAKLFQSMTTKTILL